MTATASLTYTEPSITATQNIKAEKLKWHGAMLLNSVINVSPTARKYPTIQSGKLIDTQMFSRLILQIVIASFLQMFMPMCVC